MPAGRCVQECSSEYEPGNEMGDGDVSKDAAGGKGKRRKRVVGEASFEAERGGLLP